MTTDEIQRHHANQIDCLNQHDADDRRKNPLHRARRKREHRGDEKQHGLEPVASILNVDGEAGRRHDRAAHANVLMNPIEDHAGRRGDPCRQRPDNVAIDRVEQQRQLEDEQQDGKTDQEQPATIHFPSPFASPSVILSRKRSETAKDLNREAASHLEILCRASASPPPAQDDIRAHAQRECHFATTAGTF